MFTNYLRGTLERLESGQHASHIALVFPSGKTVTGNSSARANLTIRIHAWRAVFRWLVFGASGFCEGFARGEIDIEGDDLSLLRLSKLN